MEAMATKGPGRIPDFIGVGAQRCGTTWWFQLLLEHPQIRSPRRGRKELHALDAFGARPMTDADVDAYKEHFEADPGQVCGEWTPRYLSDPWVAPLLARVAPDARLLVLLRDPIERFASGLSQRRKIDGWRIQLAASEAIERGRYASQLRGLLSHVRREQVLVLQYERCVADPIGQYRRSLDHLGVDDFLPPDPARLRGNSLAAHREAPWPDLRDALQAALADEVDDVVRICDGDIEPALWPNFRDA
jgi:hypothetical protein